MNPLRKFRKFLGLNVPDEEESKPVKREPISLERKLFKPSVKLSKGKLEPVNVREYQDDYGIYKTDEVPLMGARLSRKKK
jgi:hypothetical protein